MFERFTDRARKTMALANQEAQRLNHEYIGTEHILLGLIAEGSGVGANAMRNMNVDLRAVRALVEKLCKLGPEVVSMGKLPQTPRAKKVIEEAIRAARDLNHNYVGTEHVLLGLIREGDGVAAHVLAQLGVTLEAAQAAITALLGSGRPSDTESIANPMPLASRVDPPQATARDSSAAEVLDLSRRVGALESESMRARRFGVLIRFLIAWLAAISVIVLALAIFIAMRSR